MRETESHGVMTEDGTVSIETIDDNIPVLLQKSETAYVYICEYAPENGPQVAVAVPASPVIVDPDDLRGIIQRVCLNGESDAYRLSIMHEFSRIYIATATVRA